MVTLANWAYANGYRLRAKGMSHGWSPIVLPTGQHRGGLCAARHHAAPHLGQPSAAGPPATVTAQAGITMDT